LELAVSVEANLAMSRGSRVVDGFRRAISSGLTVPEQYCVDLVPPFHRRSIVDIGIGAGRTTGPLSEIFEQYIGVDYSPEMIQAARAEFPVAELHVMDARNLALECLVDCVMFSFNGIDCIPYEDRAMVHKQVRDLLVPGGYYIYSTHNLHHWRTEVWLNHFWAKELFRKRLYKSVVPMLNRLTLFGKQSIDYQAGFAYVNDPALGFALSNTYVDIPKECEVLKRHGFAVVGSIGNTKQTDGYDAEDNWVYIVAKRV
jgi:SAM-dependent methyltransferase